MILASWSCRTLLASPWERLRKLRSRSVIWRWCIRATFTPFENGGKMWCSGYGLSHLHNLSQPSESLQVSAWAETISCLLLCLCFLQEELKANSRRQITDMHTKHNDIIWFPRHISHIISAFTVMKWTSQQICVLCQWKSDKGQATIALVDTAVCIVSYAHFSALTCWTSTAHHRHHTQSMPRSMKYSLCNSADTHDGKTSHVYHVSTG